jgi:hypothetical protein
MKWEIAGRVALMLASVAVALVVLELGCRAVCSPSYLRHWPNLVAERMRNDNIGGACAHLHDSLLGWTAGRDLALRVTTPTPTAIA